MLPHFLVQTCAMDSKQTRRFTAIASRKSQGFLNGAAFRCGYHFSQST
jgi:hypothetical protein